MPLPDHFEVDEMTAYSGWLERNEAADQFYRGCIQLKTTCMILGTFGLQLGYHPPWVLNAPQGTTASLKPYSASTLAKIASRFLTAVNNFNSLVVEFFRSI